MSKNRNNYTHGQEIGKLQATVNDLDLRLKHIEDNELPHLHKKLDRIQWLIITTLIAVLINFASRLIN